MTELPCPACHGEMAADWGGHRAQCACGAEIHMSGGWLWPSFEVPLRPLMPDDGIEPPPGGWHFEGPEVGLDRGGALRRWLGHPTEVTLDASALTVSRKTGLLRWGGDSQVRVPTPMVQLFVPVLFDLFLNGMRGSSSSSASVPVDITGARIATHKSAVCAVTREPMVDVDEELPVWLRGRVVHLSQEWTLEWARSTAAHLNAARLRLVGGYRR